MSWLYNKVSYIVHRKEDVHVLCRVRSIKKQKQGVLETLQKF